MTTDPRAVFGRFDTTGGSGGVDHGRFGVVNPLIFPHDYPYPSPAGGDDTFDSAQEMADRLQPILSGRYGAITTKRVTLSLGGDNGRGSQSGWSNLNQRLLVQLPSTTTRWRMVFGNRDPRTNALYATARTVTGVWIGDPVFPSTGTWAAGMDNQVQAISTSFGSTSTGADGTSEWVTDPAHQFQANRPTVVSWGLTGQFASSISRAQAGGVISSTGGTSDADENAGSDFPTQALYGEYVFGDPRIEYEALDALPVVMAIGDSNTMGALPAAEGYGAMHYENWIGAAGLMNGFHVVNLAVLGSRTTDWLDDTNMVWTRFDLATTVPDACVIALGINDVSADTSADDIKANLVTIIGMVRDMGVRHIYLDTIPPNNGSGTRETVRTTVNTWIRTKPCGVAGVPDADAALRDPADTDACPALFMPTPPHFTKAGHQFRARTFMFRR